MTALETIAQRVSGGGAMTDEEARVVIASHDLIAIGMMADEVRRRLHGRRTTFVRVLELHVDAVPSTLSAGVSAGELRIVGTPASLEIARAAVQAARALAAGVPLTGFSLGELAALGDVRDTCAVLRNAGLDAIAELAVDSAADATRLVEAARAAGLLVHCLTVQNAPPHQDLAIVTRARELQREAGGFRAFAPLPRNVPVTTPTTGYDDVKLVAVARLMVGEIPSIQVDWKGYGPKLAQVALTVGADDVDGVAAADPGVLGSRRSALEEIRGNIRAAGLEPFERNGLFGAHE